jgi:hypothetical protein
VVAQPEVAGLHTPHQARLEQRRRHVQFTLTASSRHSRNCSMERRCPRSEQAIGDVHVHAAHERRPRRLRHTLQQHYHTNPCTCSRNAASAASC